MILECYLLSSSSLIQLWLLKILRVRTLEVQAVHGVFMTCITILTLLFSLAEEFLTAADWWTPLAYRGWVERLDPS